MIKTNYHTHTDFCDGQASPETIVQEAIQRGFAILGFSGHCCYPFAEDWHIQASRLGEYMQEIRRLQETYKDSIEILLGFEADYLPPITRPSHPWYKSQGLDYTIGSLHYVITPQGISTIDGPVEEVVKGIETLFSGNGRKFVENYYGLLREMIQEGGFDILGHLDCIRKRNALLHFFDESAPWYKAEIQETAKTIIQKGVIVEINTGGMFRKATQTPYPAFDILSLLCVRGVPVTVTSDAHSPQGLDFAFEETYRYAFQAGYRELVYLTREKGSVVQKFFPIELQQGLQF